MRFPTEAKRGPDGKHYVVPIDLVTTFFFFNQNVFDEHGLSAPSTYGEWIEGAGGTTGGQIQFPTPAGLVPVPGWRDALR